MMLINPATEDVIEELDFFSDQQVETILDRSTKGFSNWKKLSHRERGDYFIEVAKCLRKSKDVFANQITTEMGKILPESLAEIEKCAAACEYYARNNLMTDVEIQSNFKQSFVTYQPLGPILGILPWNFPFWQFFRFAIPTMMAGNSVILKSAANTMGCGNTIAKIFKDLQFPASAFELLNVDVPILARVIADKRVRGVSLTGSTRAGRAVGKAAGEAIKPCVLELGGSDAYVVLDDADLEMAAQKMIQGRFLNCGQSCISAKRFIVTQKNSSDLISILKHKISGLKAGSPLGNNDMGPMARKDLRDQLNTQVEQAKKEGLEVLVGGKIKQQKGYFFEPTLLSGTDPNSIVFQQELFGPVASVTTAKDEQEALAFANQSDFGLGSAVFSRDIERAKNLARTHFEAGMCFVNDFVRSEIQLPFGGIKESGIGRELSRDGLHSFVNIKTICVS